MSKTILRQAVLAVSLFASAAHAETSAAFYNVSSAALATLRNMGLPFAPTTKPHIQVFVNSDDASVSSFRVTIVTTAGVRTLLADRSGLTTMVLFDIDAPGEVKTTVESLRTVAVTAGKPQN